MADFAVDPTISTKRSHKVPVAVEWLMRLLVTLMIPLLLAIGSARLVMNPAFLAFEYNRAGFPIDQYGFSVEDRLMYGPYGINYIINNEPIAYLGDLELSGDLCFPPDDRPCPAFNSQELSHMHDVQVVAQGLFTVAFWGGLITIVLGIALWRGINRNSLGIALMQGSMLTIGLIIAIVFLALMAWDAFFGGFHQIFFEDGTWQFFYSDTLIRLYPEQFWFDASLTVGILTILGAILIFGIAWRMQSDTV